jgi:hypothetical protein
MLEIAKTIKEHIESRIREMLTITLKELRDLEYVHDMASQRQFLSGKVAAYEEILKLIS